MVNEKIKKVEILPLLQNNVKT